jgi:hypothetical protein
MSRASVIPPRVSRALGEELPAAEQDRRTPFAPRCLKDIVVALPAVGVALPPTVRQVDKA